MKLIVEAWPAQPYKFKLLTDQDDNARLLGSCWANDLYVRMAEYASGYNIDEVVICGPLDFAEGIAHKARKSEVADYVRKTKINVLEVK